MLGSDLANGKPPHPREPGLDNLIRRDIASVKTFHIQDMFVEIFDERWRLALRVNSRPDISGEQNTGRMVEEMEVSGRVHKMGGNEVDLSSRWKSQVSSAVRNSAETRDVVHPVMQKEPDPELRNVDGCRCHLKPGGETPAHIGILVTKKNIPDRLGIDVVGQIDQNAGKHTESSRIDQKTLSGIDDQVLIGLDTFLLTTLVFSQPQEEVVFVLIKRFDTHGHSFRRENPFFGQFFCQREGDPGLLRVTAS